MLKLCCDALEQKSMTIAFIESASSGYLCSQFSIYKNSGADILLGGLVSYDPSIKREILKVDPLLIEKFTAESAEVTQAMAEQGQQLFFHADFVVACTGLLKPGGSATVEKPEGTFYISILHDGRIYNYHYFILGTALERLDQLTENVAHSVLDILNAE
ncbi:MULTISPECIES: CinA family protein [Acinetobacter]|uniref:CinA family protein n=1 Tax=Acinetobacter TaxID=469 RepID=UPI0015D2B34E|nr:MULTISPECIES: CinA family protein [Acinetobacter]MCL6232607.1 CinA family protein [Acinetobacter amyesii]UUS63893.1 CinA family protein [Acinetobacter sp. YH12068_T]